MGAPTPRILVADDDDAVRRSLARDLADLGLILEASDGGAALGLVNDLRVDLVISDTNMPRMGGITLLKTIAVTHPAIRRALMSGTPLPEFEALAASGVAHSFIQKPWSRDELRQTVLLMLAERARPDLSERRRAIRAPVEVHVMYDFGIGDPACRGLTIDLSPEGARIRGPLFGEGRSLEVFLLSGEGAAAGSLARVMWSRPAPPSEFGVRFVHFMNDASRDQVERWVLGTLGR